MNRSGIVQVARAVMALLLASAGFGWTGAAAQDGAEPAPQLVELTAADVEAFIAAIDELGPVGQRAGAALLGGAAGDGSQGDEAVVYGLEALAILQRHGFDALRFQQVGYSIALALAASELGISADEAGAARDALRAARAYVSPEQYVLLEERLDTALRLYQTQPPGNVPLVGGYRDRLLALARQ